LRTGTKFALRSFDPVPEMLTPLLTAKFSPAELCAEQAHKPSFAAFSLGGYGRIPDNFNAIGVVENVKHRLIHL
jgi:hypothetical protein